MTVHERQELKKMIEYEIGAEISENARFFDELGIDGDDCIALMQHISQNMSLK